MAGTRSSEIRRDIVFNKFVIFSQARGRRPSEFKHSTKNSNSSSSCPFCIGREDECAPEIFRIPHDTSNWKIRVIENLFPALQRDLEMPSYIPVHRSGTCSISGYGIHDVVIESPSHRIRLSDLPDTEIGGILMAFKARIEQLMRGGAVKYVQVFKNYGSSAGASMSHSHSQIIGLPFIPPTVSARLGSMGEYFKKTGKCGVCDIQPDGDLMIDGSYHFYTVAPFAAAFPFEIWIIPREHTAHFHEIDNEKAVDLGRLLKLTLRKLSKEFDDPPFNFMIHTSPFQAAISSLLHMHWFLQIVPQLSVVGGFEIGSGCYINNVFPEDAARVLRELDISES